MANAWPDDASLSDATRIPPFCGLGPILNANATLAAIEPSLAASICPVSANLLKRRVWPRATCPRLSPAEYPASNRQSDRSPARHSPVTLDSRKPLSPVSPNCASPRSRKPPTRPDSRSDASSRAGGSMPNRLSSAIHSSSALAVICRILNDNLPSTSKRLPPSVRWLCRISARTGKYWRPILKLWSIDRLFRRRRSRSYRSL